MMEQQRYLPQTRHDNQKRIPITNLLYLASKYPITDFLLNDNVLDQFERKTHHR